MAKARERDESGGRLLGYLVGGAIVVVAVVAAIALLAGGDDAGSGSADTASDLLPEGGSFPELEKAASIEAAAKAAGCELDSYRVEQRNPHVFDIDEVIEYPTKPPAGGRHYAQWADDLAYEDPPDVKLLVHSLEHGRVVIWFKRGLPRDARAALKAYYDDDPYQTILVPDTTGMTYDVAATAWNRDPEPQGTGRLLGCPRYGDEVFTALEAFKDEHRGRGPEPIP